MPPTIHFYMYYNFTFILYHAFPVYIKEHRQGVEEVLQKTQKDNPSLNNFDIIIKLSEVRTVNHFPLVCATFLFSYIFDFSSER